MELTFRIKQPCDVVFNQLSDLQKFVLVHPVISKIDAKSDNIHLIYETLKIGFIPFTFRYPASVESNVIENTIVMQASVMNLVKIRIKFVLKPDGDFTTIDETVEFSSFLPVHFIMKQVFKKQHKLLFENIEKLT